MPRTGSPSATATSIEAQLDAGHAPAPAGRRSAVGLGAVQAGLDVGAAGQQQAVEAAGVVGRVDVLGQVHRQPAGVRRSPGRSR